MLKPRQSLTLTLLQAREAAMSFFRPSLNEHGLTEQQWRVIRILSQHDELEIYQLAELACILKPSMTGVLVRMEAAGMVHRRKAEQDQRRVLVTLAEKGMLSGHLLATVIVAAGVGGLVARNPMILSVLTCSGSYNGQPYPGLDPVQDAALIASVSGHFHGPLCAEFVMQAV